MKNTFWFKIRYHKLKKLPNPLKMFAHECATNFSYFLSKDEKKDIESTGRLLEHGFDLKNVIDDFGLFHAPEQPPFDSEEFEKMKRIRRTNFLLMIAFIVCEGAFNYFALKAMLPGRNVFIEIIRIATAVIISLMALFLVENFVMAHFQYIMLKIQEKRTQEENKQLVKLRSRRNMYFTATIILATVLIALGIIREFIIAGGTTVNLWIMLVTVGLAIIVAIALGLQGAEVTEIIHKYRRMIKWKKFKSQIDQTEREIQNNLDFIDRQIEKDVNNQWAWMNYVKRWLLREYDNDDQNKNENEKDRLVYNNFHLFKVKLMSQSQSTLSKLNTYREQYKKLVNFNYQKFIEDKKK
ncbi:MAG: hypothetical protein ACOY90_18565 [Candidatus Zhuqueibacterota bacterium]